jgi:hypothetical protein
MIKARRIFGSMMIPLLCVVLGTAESFGQIPNAGFESWATDPDTNNNPVGWQTTNSYPLINVDPFSPGRQGNFALRVKTVSQSLFTFPGVALLETAYAFGQRPTKFSAWVRSTIMPGDRAYLIVGLMRGDSIIASMDSCTFKIDSSFSQFTYHEFPISFQSNLVPDSLVIIVASGLAGGHAGTELIVDDIAFTAGGSTVVLNSPFRPGGFALSQNYPNPFNPVTTIRYQIPAHGYVSLKVFDLLGREIATLVDGMKTPGDYSTTWDASNATSGVYFYRLQSGAFTEAKKLVVLR